MKKLNVSLMLGLSILLFACQKENAIKPGINPQNSAVQSQQNNTVTNPNALPQFDEHNTKAIPFDQFPENLKKAEAMHVGSSAAVKPGTPSSELKMDASYQYYMGPWGGSGGGGYSIYPANSEDRIYALAFRAGSYVDGMIVWYVRTNGTLYSYTIGGSGGAYYIQYLSSTEHLTAVYGRSGAYIDRLGFYTNYKVFSYGGNGGGAFYAPTAPNTQILGFFGGSGIYVDRLGTWVYTD